MLMTRKQFGISVVLGFLSLLFGKYLLGMFRRGRIDEHATARYWTDSKDLVG
jgi:hypothetical protein